MATDEEKSREKGKGAQEVGKTMSPDEKKNGLGAPPSDSEHAGKQKVRKGTVHEESGQKEKSSWGWMTDVAAAFGRKAKESFEKYPITAVATIATAGAAAYAAVTNSRSSDSGKANQVTENKENEVSD